MSAHLQRASRRVQRVTKGRIGPSEEENKKLLHQLALGFLDSDNIKPVCNSKRISPRWRPIFSSHQVAADHFKAYICGSRNGVGIVDSDKTLICLRNACNFMARVRGEKSKEKDDRKLLYQLAWEFVDNTQLAAKKHKDGLAVEVLPTEGFPRSELDKLVHQHLVKRLREIKVAQTMAQFYR